MITRRSATRGCLLGLAVGDAMGYTVDTKTWAQIQEDYGPYGLMGYDLVNGYADVTSHTQLAAFSCNGLLIGQTRGQVKGTMAPYVGYVGLSQREWAMGQRRYDQKKRCFSWVFQVNEFRRRHCTDTRMVEILNRGRLGSLEEPVNSFDEPASIAGAVAAGMFGPISRMGQPEIDRLGAECVALTYGSPLAFLAGAMTTHLISACLKEPETPLPVLANQAADAMLSQFGREYRQAKDAAALVHQAISMAESRSLKPVEAMEKLKCVTGAEALAGAVYAAILCEEDFDQAMIVAVNHSGASAAVGCLTGAILGARLGEEALPDFYTDSLEVTSVLRRLADDMLRGCPMTKGSLLYDVDWDRKYLNI